MLQHKAIPTIDGKVLITLVCMGDKQRVIPCSISQYDEALDKYQDGAMIQEAFSFLPAEEREFFMTGMTPEEWNRLFGEPGREY